MEPHTAQGRAPRPGTITAVLEDVRRGDPDAPEALFGLVYAELKRLASAKMRHQPADHTLQPTALVNEAYLRLMGGVDAGWEDRSRFFAAAARAMRWILVDFARSRRAQKRGGAGKRVTFHEERHAERDPCEELILVHEALAGLERIDPLQSRIVEHRFFAGLSVEETAAVLRVTERTVYRGWKLARAWLYREITR